MAPACVLITGFTGFVGKVVVEHLYRQQLAGLLPAHEIVVLIRSTKDKTAVQRFQRLRDAICFSELDPNWHASIKVVEGDLERPQFGLASSAYKDLCNSVTHIIHMAAATDFDMPIQKAAEANIDTSLNMLDFARDCTHLQRLVDTSTAYVHTATSASIPERLAPLPLGWSAQDLYQAIRAGRVDEKELLRSSGHPNTYTLTKCLSEHLLAEAHGNIPLSIVRPSIINVALQYPFPGYTDSYGAFGGAAALFGAGFLHVMRGTPSRGFDFVPVDIVAQHLIDASGLATFTTPTETSPPLQTPKDPLRITHCVAGAARTTSYANLIKLGVPWFQQPGHKTYRDVFWTYTGPRGARYYFHKLRTQDLPLCAAKSWFWATRNEKQLKLTRTLSKGVKKCNESFPYFVSNHFDFENDTVFPDAFDVDEYIYTSCRGWHRHLVRRELWVSRPTPETSSEATTTGDEKKAGGRRDSKTNISDVRVTVDEVASEKSETCVTVI